MSDIITDNRFEVICKAKEHLLEATNIETSPDEMAVLDSFLFRCWQMGWLKQYDVAPVRHGHWQITDAYPHNVYCSECHTKYAQTHWAVWDDGSLPRRFCPNCGARMDEDTEY